MTSKSNIVALAAVLAASLFLSGCFYGPARGGLSEVMKHCTAYGPLRYGAGGPGFGVSFACGVAVTKTTTPR